MNDDVIGKVAEAAERAFDHSPSDDPWDDVARAAVAAHTDYLLALGGVTDEDVFRATEDWFANDDNPIRGLIARAVAQAVADKDAEIERLTEGVVHWERAELERTHERDALAAKIARVEALIDGWADDVRPARTRTPSVIVTPHPNAGAREAIRAALADEDGDA